MPKDAEYQHLSTFSRKRGDSTRQKEQNPLLLWDIWYALHIAGKVGLGSLYTQATFLPLCFQPDHLLMDLSTGHAFYI